MENNPEGILQLWMKLGYGGQWIGDPEMSRSIILSNDETRFLMTLISNAHPEAMELDE